MIGWKRVFIVAASNLAAWSCHALQAYNRALAAGLPRAVAVLPSATAPPDPAQPAASAATRLPATAPVSAPAQVIATCFMCLQCSSRCPGGWLWLVRSRDMYRASALKSGTAPLQVAATMQQVVPAAAAPAAPAISSASGLPALAAKATPPAPVLPPPAVAQALQLAAAQAALPPLRTGGPHGDPRRLLPLQPR